MARTLGRLLIVVIVVVAAFSAYLLGHEIISTGHEYASLSSGSTGSTETATVAAGSSGRSDRRELQIRVGLLTLGAVALVIVLTTLVGAMSRSRRRERWRA